MKCLPAIILTLQIFIPLAAFAETEEKPGLSEETLVVENEYIVERNSKEAVLDADEEFEVKSVLSSRLPFVLITSKEKPFNADRNTAPLSTDDDLCERLLRAKKVKSCMPNVVFSTAIVPNDNFWSLEWYLKNTANGGARAPQAWDVVTGDSNTVVAVFDSGIDYHNSDLTANLWYNTGEVNGNGVDDDGNNFVDDFGGWNFAVNTAGAPSDVYDLGASSHGTKVNSILGARGNNGVGLAGTVWNIKLMQMRVCNETGQCAASAVLSALEQYVFPMKVFRGINVKVINMSLGGPAGGGMDSSALYNALNYAGTIGITVVAAAGNTGLNTDVPGNAFYPAYFSTSLTNLLSVAAHSSTYARWSGSNYGIGSVDIAAGGVDVFGYTRGSGTGAVTATTGTSMAAPIVSGAAVLYSIKHPSYSPATIVSKIKQYAAPKASWTNLSETGGVLDMTALLQN